MDQGIGQARSGGPDHSSDASTLRRVGPFVVGFAVVAAIATFAIFAGFTPVAPTSDVVIALFAVNGAIILLLVALVLAEGWPVIAAWRARAAGARLHLRIVGLFSIIAAVPAIVMAIVGSVTLERSLNPAFTRDFRSFILRTTEAGRQFSEAQCRSVLQEARLTAFDLDRSKPLYDVDPGVFRDYFSARVKLLGFTTAVILRRDGTLVERGDGAGGVLARPDAADFDDADHNELACLVLDEGRSYVALRPMPAFGPAYLYAARPVDPFAVRFAQESADLIGIYDVFDAHRLNIQIAFATMFGLLALIMLLSAVWLGLSFATRLAAPIRRLIAATDQVAIGNLYVQVPVRRLDGDLAHLGQTFNKMTAELRFQQNRLVAASNLIDERRVFTEAVLSGVPAAVFGLSADGHIDVVNPTAQRLIGDDAALGQGIDALLPELAPALAEARAGRSRLTQGQVVLTRAGRERTFNVRVTARVSADERPSGHVVTLDDITDLVSAQRTSAWADVARRIAHEIKNPLTPIQLSAERLKRRYGRTITEGREVFDQCTDTIIRQVDDIKRMVDEFSSFARMPKARLEEDDLSACVRQVVFLMETGHGQIAFEQGLPDEPVRARFDRRLVSQALTNIVKNAAEGIASAQEAGTMDRPGRIGICLRVEGGSAVIDVTDNGVGFPAENRGRLLEPYMTTRKEGTGLGLPIVAKILEDHGGAIQLLDAPDGQGALVRLQFPIGSAPELHRDARTLLPTEHA